MTDATLRELERRFRASGLVADEADWLRGRVVAGRLEPSKLELAAYLEHEAAQLACTRVASCDPPPSDLDALPSEWQSQEDWSRGRASMVRLLKGLAVFDPRAVLVAVLALVQNGLPHSEDPQYAGDAQIESAMQAAWKWTESPTEANLLGLEACQRAAWPDLRVSRFGGELELEFPLLEGLPVNAVPGNPKFIPFEGALALGILWQTNREPGWLSVLGTLLSDVLVELGTAAATEAIRQSLVQWALSAKPPLA